MAAILMMWAVSDANASAITIFDFEPNPSGGQYAGNEDNGPEFVRNEIVIANTTGPLSFGGVGTPYTMEIAFTGNAGFASFGGSFLGGFALVPDENNDNLAAGYLQTRFATSSIDITLTGFNPSDVIDVEGMGIQGPGDGINNRDVVFSLTAGGTAPDATVTSGIVEVELDAGTAFESVFTGLTGSTSYTLRIVNGPTAQAEIGNLSALRVSVAIPEPTSAVLAFSGVSLAGFVGRHRPVS